MNSLGSESGERKVKVTDRHTAEWAMHQILSLKVPPMYKSINAISFITRRGILMYTSEAQNNEEEVTQNGSLREL